MSTGLIILLVLGLLGTHVTTYLLGMLHELNKIIRELREGE